MSAYHELETLNTEISQLQEVSAILSWDEACMMPAAAGSGRGNAMASLDRVLHGRATNPRIGDLLDQADEVTYTLGALMAAQWFDCARKAEASIANSIARADLKPLLTWLRPAVHEQGRRLSMQPLLKSVTGSELDAGFFKRHIQNRYLNS